MAAAGPQSCPCPPLRLLAPGRGGAGAVAAHSCSRGSWDDVCDVFGNRDGVYPSSSLVFAASSLSISAAASSAICWICGKTMVSSDTLFLDFFTWVMLLLLTFLRASLDLLVDCLASLARLSLCSLSWGMDTHLGTGTRITVPSTSGFRFMPLSLMAFAAAAVLCVLTSGKLLMFTVRSCGDFCEICPSWFSGNFPSFVTTSITQGSYQPGEVLTLRFLLKSSFRASMTACISSLVSSKLIISSTRAALIFTLFLFLTS
uniref:Uncharacterized protein n=1 Tax=Geospiza parvula TaxID=87175 RepID=A0A8C3MG87_GEOPR